MKKETIIAILLGVLFGVVVAVGVTIKTKSKPANKVEPITNALPITPTVSVQNVEFQTLEITEPVDGVIVSKNTIDIKGKAAKGGLLVIQSPIKNATINNEADTFVTNFPLATGENVILVTFYPKEQPGSPQEKELKVYYLDEQ